MATYTVTGHGTVPTTGIDPEVLRAQLHLLGVGQPITITLNGGDDTKVKGHGILK
jgi:hypothetical protein